MKTAAELASLYWAPKQTSARKKEILRQISRLLGTNESPAEFVARFSR